MQSRASFETITLTSGATRAWIAPERGGMLTRFEVSGRDVLYMDEETLCDPTKNVRGGNPVLFPSPGPLAEGRFARGGRQGAMKQHGLARQRAFRVVSTTADEATLELASDAGTRAEFPWDFVLTLRYAVGDGRVRIEHSVRCAGDAPLPYAFGFHPYFVVPSGDKARARIETPATRAWDNVGKRMVDVTSPIPLAEGEVDLHLVDHGRSDATLGLPDGRQIVVSGSAAYTRWVIWTLPGRDFVCLEPWTGPANALNTGEGLRTVAPGSADELFVEIAVR